MSRNYNEYEEILDKRHGVVQLIEGFILHIILSILDNLFVLLRIFMKLNLRGKLNKTPVHRFNYHYHKLLKK